MRARGWIAGAALALAVALAVAGCSDGKKTPQDAGPDGPLDSGPGDGGSDGDAMAPVPDPPAEFAEVEQGEVFDVPGLSGPVFVVYTESGVPHVYAENREDLSRVLGFVMARDRYTVMDLTRRLSLGQVSELLGQDALQTDMESRGTGMRHVAQAILARLTDEQAALFDAFSEGINAYIGAVDAGDAPPPAVYDFAKLVLGTSDVTELMRPFDRESVAAVMATFTYELGYETGDVGREQAAQALADGLYADSDPLKDLREAGAMDVFTRVTPHNGFISADGWGLETADGGAGIVDGRERPGRTTLRWDPQVPRGMLSRLSRRLERIQARLGRDHAEGFGSNSWAVGGDLTADGAAILEGDGHLGGSVPTLFWRMGLDTQLLGGGNTQQVGLSLPGAPFMAVGTNGDVAWSQTQFFGDITDWYREEIVLDSEGMPSASMFGGSERDLVRVEEEYVVADIDGLGSEGRTETWPRFETFDGRMITSIEGEEVDAGAPPGAGESVVNLLGDYVIPKDMDGDGTITAVSFDYTGLEGPNFAQTLDRWGHASTVREMYEASGWLVAYSQNIAAADKDGSVMYTGYQVMPCREHLRAGDGTWADGANPGRLIDGTQYGGFSLPLTEDGEVDEAAGEGDPNGCVVPLDEYPAAIDPSEGYVVNANNAPGTMGIDNDLENDPWYIGGPWHEDFRATRIAEMIEAESGGIDEDAVASMQADVRSPLGALFVPYVLESIEAARTAASGSPADGTPEARLKALYDDNSADLDELEARLSAWQDAGYQARSGVETFYNSPDAQERADAVATTLFNAWLGPFVRMTLDDERFRGRIYHPTGSGGRARVLKRMVEGRGAGNPLSMPSWNSATEESAFFDVLETSPIETSEEVAVMAAVDALAFLRSDPDGEGGGGFGNDDWDTWLWGLRHHTRFDSLLADFLEGDEEFGFLVDMFSITTEQLPLAESLPDGDPRAVLSGFPRGGDNFVVDAANPGYSGTDFTFGSIPVFRMVVALRGDETTGRNILPGGQSALPDADHYSDQAALWLANDTSPMRLTPTQVAAGATHLDTFH